MERCFTVLYQHHQPFFHRENHQPTTSQNLFNLYIKGVARFGLKGNSKAKHVPTYRNTHVPTKQQRKTQSHIQRGQTNVKQNKHNQRKPNTLVAAAPRAQAPFDPLRCAHFFQRKKEPSLKSFKSTARQPLAYK